MRVEALSGPALEAALEDLARLRIAVFREWPYLYEGDPEYEAHYQRSYHREGAILVAAREGERIVGAATGMPLTDHDDATQMEGLPVPPETVFYCAESVLLPEFRGRGLGRAFFDRREAHAREAGFAWSAFCAVVRAEDHPARPEGYRPLDGFWRRRGYEPVDGAGATFRWRDRGEAEETPHELRLWMRAL